MHLLPMRHAGTQPAPSAAAEAAAQPAGPAASGATALPRVRAPAHSRGGEGGFEVLHSTSTPQRFACSACKHPTIQPVPPACWPAAGAAQLRRRARAAPASQAAPEPGRRGCVRPAASFSVCGCFICSGIAPGRRPPVMRHCAGAPHPLQATWAAGWRGNGTRSSSWTIPKCSPGWMGGCRGVGGACTACVPGRRSSGRRQAWQGAWDASTPRSALQALSTCRSDSRACCMPLATRLA